MSWGNPVYHIGISAVVASADGTKVEILYQSNGHKDYSCEENAKRSRGCNKKSYEEMKKGWGKESYR